MRVFFLGINYWPEDTGIAPYNVGRCEWLAARGHEVWMITALPYYPQWRIYKPYRFWRPCREERNGVKILRLPIYVPSRPTTLRRILHEASFGLVALFACVTYRKPDLLVVVSPPLILGAVAQIVSKLWGIPYLFHVTDIQPDTAKELGMLRAKWIFPVLESLERSSYRKAAFVTTLTEGMKERILAKGVPEESVRICPDWVEQEVVAPVAEDCIRELRQTEGWEGKCVVLHVGNVGVKQGLNIVIEAAKRTRSDDNILWVILGDGAAKRGLEEQARSLGLRSLCFYPVLPRERFRVFLSAADLCLISQRREVLDFVFPSKTRVLLGAGKAVIAAVNPKSEVARIVLEAGAGWVIPPEDGEALYSLVKELKEKETLVRTAGERGSKYARERWRKEVILERWAGLLEEVGVRKRSLAVMS